MIVADVMTRNVISIAPDATVENAVNLMLSRHISGLFVVDKAGDLTGVVTEGDLLRRDELGTQRGRPWWIRLLSSPASQATDFVHALRSACAGSLPDSWHVVRYDRGPPVRYLRLPGFLASTQGKMPADG